MSDNFDDEELNLDDDNFDEFDDDKKQSLGDLINKNPAVKIGVVVAAVVIVFGIVITIGGNDSSVSTSRVGQGADVTSTPGTEELTEEYLERIKEVDERELEIAQDTGGSALPTLTDTPVGVLSKPEQLTEEEDPLQRWRRLQEERLERELQQTQTVDSTVVEDQTQRNEAVQQLAENMSAQMQAMLESKESKVSYRSIMSAAEFATANAPAEGDENANGPTGDDAAFNGLEEEVIQEILLPAGEILYAQLLIEANTDAPGPVLAQIVSGPLNGYRIIGEFEEERNYLTLNFSTIVIDGESIGINAVAIDPRTTLPGFATEINRHYLKRIILPAAAAFITGLTEAIAESGTTTVTIEGETVTEESEDLDSEQEIATGVAEAGAEISEIIDEEIDDIEVMIRVAPGTAMGILFVEAVVTQDDTI